jgi:hypothetical protein
MAQGSDRDLSAVCLTPLLTEPSVIDGLACARCPTLLAGGTADASWQAEAIPTNPALDVLELPGVVAVRCSGRAGRDCRSGERR